MDNKENFPVEDKDTSQEIEETTPVEQPVDEDKKESGGHPFLTAFVIAFVAIIALCLCWLGFFKLIHKDPLVMGGDSATSISSEVESNSNEIISHEDADSDSESTASSDSEASDSESAASETATTQTAGGNKSAGGTATQSSKNNQQAVAVEPRMKKKTETWADRPIPPDEHGYYGVLYAPDINTEESVFFGDEQNFLDAGWGQQTDTFLVGYECAHLFWTDNEKCVQEMQWMYPGLRFQIETDSGIYVYEVETYANGHWDVNPDRRDVTEYRIYNNNKEELANIYTTYDVVYLAHQKDDGSVDVVEAHLVI